MDLLEVELKAYCDDREKIIGALGSLGAKFLHTLKQEDTYFNHPSRDFRVTDEAFRIRRYNDKIIITYKGPKLGDRAKTRLEEEVEIDNFYSMKRICTYLGFTETRTVVKTRDVYRCGEIEVCVDRVENLGEFIELEKMHTDREKGEQDIFDLASKLGLQKFERKSYLELLLEKK